jgi:hypothetical protein
MAKATKKHTPRKSGRGSQKNPAKIEPSPWVAIEDVFQQWRRHLGSKEAASELEALLCDSETRSAIRYVDASGKEVPGTPKYLDAGFWRGRLLLVPDADGGADHLVIDYTPSVHVEFELPEGGHWEFFVRRHDVERWERPYPPLAAPLSAPSKERKPTPKKKRRKTKQAPHAGAPEQHDWEEGKLFVMQELKTRGSPLDKNQVKGWKSKSDVARLLIDHFEHLPGGKPGSGPDMSTARGKVSDWIQEFEGKRS